MQRQIDDYLAGMMLWWHDWRARFLWAGIVAVALLPSCSAGFICGRMTA